MAVIQLRKFEKLDYKVCKNQGDIEFLKLCQENGFRPKFLTCEKESSLFKFI